MEQNISHKQSKQSIDTMLKSIVDSMEKVQEEVSDMVETLELLQEDISMEPEEMM